MRTHHRLGYVTSGKSQSTVLGRAVYLCTTKAALAGLAISLAFVEHEVSMTRADQIVIGAIYAYGYEASDAGFEQGSTPGAEAPLLPAQYGPAVLAAEEDDSPSPVSAAPTNLDIGSGTIQSYGGDRLVLEARHDLDEGEHFGIRIFNADFSSHGGVPDDTVAQIGFNTGNPRGDPGLPAMYLQFERKFNNPGQVVAHEFFLQHVGEDGSIHRPLGFYLPRSGGAGSLGGFQLDTVLFYDWSGDLAIKFDLLNRQIFMTDVRHMYGFNNRHVAFQMNSTGNAFLPLPYINNFDQLVFSTPTHQQTSPGTNLLGVNAYNTRLYANPGGAGSVTYGNYGRIQGTAEGRFWENYFEGSVSNILYSELYNSHPTGRTIHQLRSVGGNVSTIYWAGSNRWAIGNNVSDGSFRFTNTSALGQPGWDALVIAPLSAGYLATFSGPVRLPRYLQTALPSASQMGAGAMVYVTSAGTIAVSDGVDWRYLAIQGSVGNTAQAAATATPSSVPQPAGGPSIPAPAPTEVAAAEPAPPPAPASTATATAQAPAAAPAQNEESGQGTLASSSSTHSAPGLGSAESRAAQTGPTRFVTSDQAGNLAFSDFGPADLLDLSSRMGAVEGRMATLQNDVRRANGGIAAAMALGGTFLPPGKDIAISFNIATFAGEQGFSATGVARLSDQIWINAGVAGSTVGGSTGGRAGVTLGW